MEGGKNTNYWPGFVDALTNVVIAMVFVIIVLALSLSFSAQLLAKRMAARIAELEQQGKSTQVVPVTPPTAAVPPPLAAAQSTPAPPDSGVPGATRIAVRGNEGVTKLQGGKIRVAARYLLLEFEPGALTLDEAADKQLGQSLDQITSRLQNAPKNTRVMLIASGPDMALSENQRSGFIRTMAVRNALLQKGIPGTRIGTRFDLKANSARPTVSIAIEDGAP
ncbi:hypothetical protein [Actimicrobium antarcticum]|uniref:OmpA-like domain-containing protein n=1 Tax=Actimicrobium antarcticum TaxID=1051899 RepID=A0ABP7SZD3_9BURK